MAIDEPTGRRKVKKKKMEKPTLVNKPENLESCYLQNLKLFIQNKFSKIDKEIKKNPTEDKRLEIHSIIKEINAEIDNEDEFYKVDRNIAFDYIPLCREIRGLYNSLLQDYYKESAL